MLQVVFGRVRRNIDGSEEWQIKQEQQIYMVTYRNEFHRVSHFLLKHGRHC